MDRYGPSPIGVPLDLVLPCQVDSVRTVRPLQAHEGAAHVPGVDPGGEHVVLALVSTHGQPSLLLLALEDPVVGELEHTGVQDELVVERRCGAFRSAGHGVVEDVLTPPRADQSLESRMCHRRPPLPRHG